MSYASQFQKVKKIVSSISANDLNRVLVQEGRIYATDDRMVISTTFDTDLEFFVDAATFGSALVGRNVQITMEDGMVVVKSEKDTNRVATIEARPLPRPEGDWIEVPPKLLHAFETLTPFQAEDRTREWACAITVRDGLMFATNNCILGVWEDGGSDINASFPSWLVEYVLSLDAEPTGLIVEEDWVAFKFDDGTEVRALRLAREMIDQAVEMGKAIERNGAELPEGWSAAIQYVADLPGCETVVIEPHRVYAETADGSRERAIDSPTTKESLWDPDWIVRVARAATNLDLDAWPNPATWYGPNVRGLIIGKVQ